MAEAPITMEFRAIVLDALKEERNNVYNNDERGTNILANITTSKLMSIVEKYLETDPPTPVCPECRSGKCANCPGESLDFQDNIVECPCAANEHR